MRSTKYLSQPLYIIGGLLVALPTIDFVLAISPMRVHTVSWRFGAGGILTRALLTPFLGLLIWFVTAWFLEHRVMLRIVAVLSGAVAIVLSSLAILFVLDGIQMRGQVAPPAKTAFLFTVVTVLVKDAAFILAGLIVTRAGWKSGRRPSGSRDQADAATMLMHDPAMRRWQTPTGS